MKTNIRKFIPALLLGAIAAGAVAQVENAGGVRRRADREKKNQEQAGPQITDRMQGFYEKKETHDADLSYMRQIYRMLDLTKDSNTPLYFPEDVIDGQENLFRMILRLVTEGRIPAYEYLDGREVFTDQYKVNVPDMLDRFGIYYTKAGSDRNPKITIEEADVPTGQVLTYYILERWEFDRRSNQMRTKVEAICPVLNRSGDFGGEARYPMFWVKFDQLRPFLAQQHVFLTDDNNLQQYSLDDFFNLAMYDGEIYKTRNLRNLSMAQMFPDPDDLKRAQDSIDRRLKEFGKDLWVPSREEFLAMKEKEEAAKEAMEASADSIPERTVAESNGDDSKVTTVRSSKRRTTKRSAAKKTSASDKTKKSTAPKKTKVKKAKAPSSSSGNSSAAKSVRRRKR